jgi:hypothetical protein
MFQEALRRISGLKQDVKDQNWSTPAVNQLPEGTAPAADWNPTDCGRRLHRGSVPTYRRIRICGRALEPGSGSLMLEEILNLALKENSGEGGDPGGSKVIKALRAG